MAGEVTDLDQKVKHMDKGKWLLVVIGFITLIITYKFFKRSQAQSSTQATQQTATATGQGLIDPTTGIPYALEAPGQGLSGTGTTDFSTLNSNLNSLIAQEGALTTALTNATSPPQGSSATAQQDYSAYGPYANSVAADYQAALGRAPDLSGMLDWIQNVTNLVGSGETVQQAENTTAKQIASSPEGQAYQHTGAAQPGTTNTSGFFTAKAPTAQPLVKTTPGG